MSITLWNPCFRITVLEVLEAVWSFRVKAKVCVCLREKICWCVAEWGHSGVVFSFVCFPLLLPVLFNPYASSSKPRPILCPPAFTFFPSIRAERVSFTPAGKSVTLYHVTIQMLFRLLSQNTCFWMVFLFCFFKEVKRLTWPECLCVSNSNETGVVNLGLWGETDHQVS